MKNTFIILAICVMPFSALFANNFGVVGGLNLNRDWTNYKDESFDMSSDEDRKTHIGFHLGALVEIPFSKKFALETGLHFNLKGAKRGDNENGDKYKEYVNYSYLHIPITAKIMFPVNDDSKFYVQGGPFAGILLSGQNNFEQTVDDEIVKEFESYSEIGNDNEDDIRRMDYGLTVGVGFEYKNIIYAASYERGLRDLTHAKSDDNSLGLQAFKLTLGYMFLRRN